jgi:hypothetical protein
LEPALAVELAVELVVELAVELVVELGLWLVAASDFRSGDLSA